MQTTEKEIQDKTKPFLFGKIKAIYTILAISFETFVR